MIIHKWNHINEVFYLFYIVEFHPEKMELMLSGATIHKYQFEELLDFSQLYDAKKWNRVLLYLQPTIIVKNEFELYAGYIFLQDMFKQHLQPPPPPNTSLNNPNINR